MTTISIARSALAGISRAAQAAAPDECCGILLGHAGYVEEARAVMNVANDRRRRFEIDPQALVDAYRAARSGGPQVVGYYHSHPGGAAAPSATDQAMANRDGSVWAIAGDGGVTFWRDAEAGFERLSYEVRDG